MGTIDRNAIPASTWQQFKEAGHSPENYSPELAALLDPNIVARRTNLPMANQIQIINREQCYYWARRIQGKSADHNNYRTLRMYGYTNATCKPDCTDESGKCGCDVHPLIAEINADGTEITLGADMVLVKARPDVHFGRQKSYLRQAIDNVSPRNQVSNLPPDERGALAATRTYVPGVDEQEQISRRASAQNTVRRGTPQWDAIAKSQKESKEKE
jgi:hypothetical protein